jgi:hypothetical protein
VLEIQQVADTKLYIEFFADLFRNGEVDRMSWHFINGWEYIVTYINDTFSEDVIGNNKGEILFYRNTSSSNNTLNPSFTLSNSSFPGFNAVNVSGFSAPAIADINKDGLKDLVIGRVDSMLSYYRNSGTLSAPDFTIVTNSFGRIKPIDSIGYQNVYDDTFAIIGYFPVYEKFIYSKPQIRDLDGDGELEIIVGNSLGTLRMYKINSASPTGKFIQIDSFHYRNAFQGRKFYNTDFGSHISPCLADFDGDTVPEILIAGSRGGLQYLKNGFKYKKKVSVSEIRYTGINGYPNPATTSIEFNIELTDIRTIEVYNQLGQLMPVNYTGNNIISLNTAQLNSGFYIINIFTTGNIVYTSKFQIIATN